MTWDAFFNMWIETVACLPGYDPVHNLECACVCDVPEDPGTYHGQIATDDCHE